MRHLHLLAWLGCMGTGSAAGLEPRTMNGLQVHSESVPGETSVNGVEFRVSRVTGRDVPVLFERVVSEWRRVADSAPPHLLRNGDWNIASRIRNGHSQVLQWRMTAWGAEMLWSDTDLRAAVSAARPSRYLTTTCRWNAPISGLAMGQRFLQSIAVCAARASGVTVDLERELQQSGWQIRRTPAGLRAHRGGDALEAVIQPAMEGGRHRNSTTVVMVETHEPRRDASPEPGQ